MSVRGQPQRSAGGPQRGTAQRRRTETAGSPSASTVERGLAGRAPQALLFAPPTSGAATPCPMRGSSTFRSALRPAWTGSALPRPSRRSWTRPRTSRSRHAPPRSKSLRSAAAPAPQSAPGPGCTCLRPSGAGSYPVRMGINLEGCMGRSCKTFSKAGRTASASSSSFARFSPCFPFSPAPFQQRHDVTGDRRACSLVHRRHFLTRVCSETAVTERAKRKE